MMKKEEMNPTELKDQLASLILKQESIKGKVGKLTAKEEKELEHISKEIDSMIDFIHGKKVLK
jgi:hypothetical protein